MKAKTTTTLSKDHEEWVARTLGGRRSRSSGASFSDPVDVSSEFEVVECKATEGESISIKRSDWLKNREKVTNSRNPMMALRFKDPYTNKSIDLLLVEAADYLNDRS